MRFFGSCQNHFHSLSNQNECNIVNLTMSWFQCLIYVELPFMEDIRQYTFGSLPVKDETQANKKYKPTGRSTDYRPTGKGIYMDIQNLLFI